MAKTRKIHRGRTRRLNGPRKTQRGRGIFTLAAKLCSPGKPCNAQSPLAVSSKPPVNATVKAPARNTTRTILNPLHRANNPPLQPNVKAVKPKTRNLNYYKPGPSGRGRGDAPGSPGRQTVNPILEAQQDQRIAELEAMKRVFINPISEAEQAQRNEELNAEWRQPLPGQTQAQRNKQIENAAKGEAANRWNDAAE